MPLSNLIQTPIGTLTDPLKEPERDPKGKIYILNLKILNPKP